MEFGPQTQDQFLKEEEERKKQETLRNYLLQKKQPEAPKQSESIFGDRQFLANMVLNLGQAADRFASADSVSRGGRGSDKSIYTNAQSIVNQKAANDAQKLKDAEEKKRLDQEDQWTQKVRGRQEAQWSDQDKERTGENDPESSESKLAQDLAKRLMPSKDFTGISAAQLKKSIPTLEKLYEVESKGLEAKNKAQEAALKRQQDLLDAERKLKTERFSTTQSLRKEYTAHPVTKSTNVMEEAYSKIQNTEATGAGDMALVFNYMKVLDPGSTVREGEFKSAAESGGLPSAIQGLYNKIKGDGLLDDKTRRQIRQQSRLYLEQQVARQQQVDEQFRDVAETNELDWTQVGMERTVQKKQPESTQVSPQQLEKIRQVVEKETKGTRFPVTISKDGKQAVVSNPEELSEAIAEGWKIQGGSK